MKPEERKEALEGQVQSLLSDFSNKRNLYAKRNQNIQLATVCVGAVISLLLGLSFIEELSFVCKIAGLFLGAVTTVLTGINGIFNYEEKWKQRSITYLKLLELKRIIQLDEKQLDKTEYTEYINRLNKIMREDAELWITNVENQQRKQERIEERMFDEESGNGGTV